MPVINQKKCVGCKICQTYCTVNAIQYDPKKHQCHIEEQLCTECYVCLRQKVCPKNAIEPIEFADFCKKFQHVLSDPVENHGVTGVTGRGTEEVKTNDVTGRVKKGEVGICIDMGRPGMGVFLRDAEKVAMACAQTGLQLAAADKTPLAALMPDLTTGKLIDECLSYRLLSVIIEGKCTESQLPEILKTLKKVEKEIDTVFSLGLILRVDAHGHSKALDCLDSLNIPYPYRGKVNVGLGQPLSLD